MLTTSGRHFLRDGKQHLIISGAVHYFRVHPDQWADRLARLRAMGANTVETYVAWNFHAPDRHVTDFTGWRDLGAFLDAAAEADLDVIVRPGPYICAEWDAGGLPAWLLTDTAMRLRCSDEAFLAELDVWFDQLIPIIAARQVTTGGRVVLVQVENEYGSFADDQDYLAYVRDGLISRGIDTMLVTSDGPGIGYLDAGTVDGVLPTINFGSGTARALEVLRAESGESPAMCMEFWNGWFDHWGEAHHTRPGADAAAELNAMLSCGMSVNFYMAHGGTNFGLYNGANFDGELQPTITSYDYDAPIAENGALTDKFWRFREVIGTYVELADVPPELAAAPPTQPAAELSSTTRGVLTVDDLVALSRAAVTGDVGPRETVGRYPPTFEDAGLERGLLVLRHRLRHPGGAVDLRLYGLHDRAHVFCDATLVGVVDRDEIAVPTICVDAERGEYDLTIIVESLGRINFGPLLGERKGICGGVWFGTHYLTRWHAWPLDLTEIGGLLRESCARRQYSAESADGLAVEQFDWAIAEPGADAWLDLSDARRGYAYLDDFLLGRYWNRGPQHSLYVPGPLLTQAQAVVTLLSTDGPGGAARTVTTPILDALSSSDRPNGDDT